MKNRFSLLIVAGLLASILFSASAPVGAAKTGQKSVKLELIGRYVSAAGAESAAEIVAYDKVNKQLFVVNAEANSVDIVDIDDPYQPGFVKSLDMSPFGAGVNSVAVCDNAVAIVVEAEVKQEPGSVVFYSTYKDKFTGVIEVGAGPDMVTFTRNCNFAVVANEGEPDDDYVNDPLGTVTIIRLPWSVEFVEKSKVTHLDFTAYNDVDLDPSIRIFGPNASVAQDLEPEYITTRGNIAYVAMQENNAMAVINLRKGIILDLVGLGYKDHMLEGNALDASNRDGAINIQNWPVLGAYQPDAIAAFRSEGRTYIVSANEGDARDYDGFSEEVRVKDLVLDPTAFPDAADLQEDENLGRLKTTTAFGDTDGDGDHDVIYSYGARSFSIWNGSGELVWDSGDQFARITAEEAPLIFNSNGVPQDFDGRSDDKGAEPESVVVGKAYGRTYAFIGLERTGGVMVYDVSDPESPVFIEYVLTYDPATEPFVDISPEGMAFVKASQSPTAKPLLVVSHEITGTVVIFQLNRVRR
ncbi:MAG: choice-of-anchor I family protein [Ardenticatenaceae bacterium]|nr:choice-of-anchor I family protein [Ardenticatenaceae bacterium]